MVTATSVNGVTGAPGGSDGAFVAELFLVSLGVDGIVADAPAGDIAAAVGKLGAASDSFSLMTTVFSA